MSRGFPLIGFSLVLAGSGLLMGEARMPRIASRGLATRAVTDGGLREAVRAAAVGGGATWIGYAEPAIDRDARMCCFDSVESMDKDFRCCMTCRLETRQSYGSFSTDDAGARVHLEPSGYFVVLLRVEAGRVGKVRAFSDDCALDAGGLPFVWLTGVSAGDSLGYLGKLVTGRMTAPKDDDDGDGDVAEQALNAIAMHADPGADGLLEGFVARGQPPELREHASFWIGQARGRRGYDILKRVAGDPDDEFRKKVIFALSQNPTPEATDTIIAIAHGDKQPQVRGEAIFWLAQKAGERASRVIARAIDDDPDTEVKKKAVFALSQLPSDEGVPLLIGLAKSHRNPEVRKESIFWLGQSGDPRALDFIEAILSSAPR